MDRRPLCEKRDEARAAPRFPLGGGYHSRPFGCEVDSHFHHIGEMGGLVLKQLIKIKGDGQDAGD